MTSWQMTFRIFLLALQLRVSTGQRSYRKSVWQCARTLRCTALTNSYFQKLKSTLSLAMNESLRNWRALHWPTKINLSAFSTRKIPQKQKSNRKALPQKFKVDSNMCAVPALLVAVGVAGQMLL